MTREAYDQRRRELDAELRAGIELLESAHHLKVGILDQAWTMLSPGPGEPPPEPPGKARAARRPSSLAEDLPAAVARLPEVFDRNDVCRELGYEPHRSVLFRALQDLVAEGTIAIFKRGEGREPTRYHRLQL